MSHTEPETPDAPADERTPVAPEAGAESGAESEEPATGAGEAAGAPPEPDSATQPDVTMEPAIEGEFAEAVGLRLTWIPYALHLFAWAALCGASVYLLGDASAGTPARFLPEYGLLTVAGLLLVALGPILSIAVWLVARVRRQAWQRRGLFVAAFGRGALTTFFGVLLWLVTLYAIDLHALGAFG